MENVFPASAEAKLYISKVILDPKKRKTAVALSNRELFHGAVESSSEGDRPHNMWRIEPDMSLIIVSREIPCLDGMQSQFGDIWNKPATKPYDGHINSISEGDLLRFKIEVNPVVNVKNGTKNGKDVPLNLKRTNAHPYSAEDWLVERLERAGAEVLRISDVSHGTTAIIKNKKKIPLFTVTYSGVLRVSDAGLVRDAMRKGIGGKKTYGCGLLTAVKIG